VAQGIWNAVEAGAGQINISQGKDWSKARKSSGITCLDAAVYDAWRMDVSVICAQGNDGNTNLKVPAGFYGAIGVGSVDRFGVRSRTSSFGNNLRIMAEGEDVYSLSVFNGFDFNSGTSFSAPQITGAISLIKAANPEILADEAEQILYVTARDAGDPGFDAKYGYGIADVGSAVTFARSRQFVQLGGAPTDYVDLGQSLLTFNPVLGYPGPLTGTIGVARVFSARLYIDYSSYDFAEIPEILTRTRSTVGWKFPDSDFKVTEAPGVRVVSKDLMGAWLETAYYLTDFNGTASGFPCANPPCVTQDESALDIQVTVAGIPPSLMAPSDLFIETYSDFKQRVRLSWPDDNVIDTGWVVERRASGDNIWTTVANLPTNATSSIIYEDSSSPGSSTLEYRVKPIGPGNSEDKYSPIATVTTPPRWPDGIVVTIPTIWGTCPTSNLQGGAGLSSAGAPTMAGGGGTVVNSGSSKAEVSTMGAGGGGGIYDPPMLQYTDRIIVSWEPPADQAVPISHYILQRVDGTTNGGFTDIGPIFDSVFATVDTICNNDINRTYPIKIWSVDSNGDTSLSYKTPGATTGCARVCFNGQSAKVAFQEESPLSERAELLGNYPNPFNPTTVISYSLPVSVDVAVSIYNLLGQHVRSFELGRQSAGGHRLMWYATDGDGNSVSSGMYFYRMKAGDFVQTRKMVLLK